MVAAAQYDFGGRTVRMVTHDMTREVCGAIMAQAHLENVESEFNVRLK